MTAAAQAPQTGDNTSEKRRQRIEAIKAEVEAGTYVVDPAQVSKKIIDAHLRKKKPSS